MEKFYVWSLSQHLIPINRYALIPYKNIGETSFGDMLYEEEYTRPHVYVNESNHKALLAFEELRIGWNESQWDTWLFYIYPFLDIGLVY